MGITVLNYLNSNGGLVTEELSGVTSNCKCVMEYDESTLKLYIDDVLIKTKSTSNPYSALGLPMIRINGGSSGNVKYVMIEELD